MTTAGTEYVGTDSQTSSGRTCQAWATQTPNSHSNNDAAYFPDSTLTEASNFCRNPDGSSNLWCYTVDPSVRWEYCEVPFCSGKVTAEILYIIYIIIFVVTHNDCVLIILPQGQVFYISSFERFIFYKILH